MESMSDDEFDLMEELYFVQAFREIQEALNWESKRLVSALLSLYQKDYIKILDSHDQDYTGQITDTESLAWEGKYYLATKKGLLQHNGF